MLLRVVDRRAEQPVSMKRQVPTGGASVAAARVGGRHRLDALTDAAPSTPLVVQGIFRWDRRQKAAAGAAVGGGLGFLGTLGAFAGGVLAAGTAAIAAPLLGVGALAGAAYLYYRHRNHPATRLANLRNRVGLTDPPLTGVLNETLGVARQPNVDVHESGAGVAHGDSSHLGARRYRARLDHTEPDPDARAAYLAHELTHISADETYPENQRYPGSFLNIPDPAAGGFGAATIAADAIAVQGQIAAVRPAIAADAVIPLPIRTHVLNRLDTYMNVQPDREFDTVANELLVYLALKNQQATATYAQITTLAQFAAGRRV